MKRINSIDVLRGLVMIIMALDHTRDLLHVSSLTQQPTDLATTSPELFFTRWITHLCAPTFVFLSGVSAWLSLKTQGIEAGRKFLLTRGLWLIVLECTVVNFGVWFDIHFTIFLFNVIAAIGVGFILLSFMVTWSANTIGLIGLCIICLHGLTPLIPFPENSAVKQLFMSLFTPGAVPFGEGKLFVMGYPPIPWAGIMMMGFAAGKVFELPAIRQRKIFLMTGMIAIILFIILRSVNSFGDPFSWGIQKDTVFTVLSFINVTKYPPSLLFCLVTLGIMCLLLFLIEGKNNILTRVAGIYGKVPLFYFLVHWYIIHPIMFLVVFLQGYAPSDLLFGFNFGRPKGESGVELWVVYLIWVGILILLYPFCRAYSNYKARHRDNQWLRYL
jgi:uncharacterized membrane protein